MQQRKLGSHGPVVSALGLGCMGMSDFYSTGADRQEAIATLHRALELGVTLLDTADMYGPHTNEELVGKRSRASGNRCSWPPFGILRDPADPSARGVSSRPEYIRRSVEGSLRRLGVEEIDLYYQHRVDPQVPIEDVVGTMADLIREGKIRHIGLSEASVATLERAHKVHPITALQTEYSLWTRDAEQGVLAACERLGIGFVPYSPLGRGFLTGAIRRPEDLAEDDFRRGNPRFQGKTSPATWRWWRRWGAGGAEGCQTFAAGAGLGIGAGETHRADPRHQAPSLPGRERRGGGDNAERG